MKAEADNEFVTLRVTYRCACETKRKKRATATGQKVKEAAQR